jgi:hypothetical protein
MEALEFFERDMNCFGYKKWSPLVIFNEAFETLRQKIKKDAIRYLFSGKEHMFEDIENICRESLRNNNHHLNSFELEISIERKLHFSQHQNGFVNNRVRERCYRIKEQLMAGISDLKMSFEPHHKLIDVGAGSGLIGQLFKQEVGLDYALLTDVVDYRYPGVRNAPGIDFRIFRSPFDHIETDQQFQVGIITNTLHHCDQPFEVLNTLTEKLEKNAILFVIESCIGVTREEVSHSSHSKVIPFQTLYMLNGELWANQKEYLQLDEECKMIYGSFFDWIYNRVFLNENINVPYNFGTPSDWNRRFEENGFRVLKTYLMGFDQPAALEFHTLHILKKSI